MKALLKEENYAPDHKLSHQACLLFFIVTMIQDEINQLFQGRACANTILVKI